MSIPIYKSNTHAVNFDKGNKGLFFERFFNQYQLGQNSAKISEKAKKDFLMPFANPFYECETFLEEISLLVGEIYGLVKKQRQQIRNLEDIKSAKEALRAEQTSTLEKLILAKDCDLAYRMNLTQDHRDSLLDASHYLATELNALQTELLNCKSVFSAENWSDISQQAEKLKTRSTVLNHYFSREHINNNYDFLVQQNAQSHQYKTRQEQLTAQLGGKSVVYLLDGHFVTGMGNEHPVKNGFLWHYTLGTPYLSGSQVKGLVRSVIEQYYQGDDKTEILLDWFGSTGKYSKENQAGELIFFDAFPIALPVLSVDIMTPHMRDWYVKSGEITNTQRDGIKIPADWHDPMPIPFLAVKEAKFLFSISKRPKSKINIDEVFKCLNYALTYMGAGAKTQTGYGFMTDLEHANEQAEIAANEQAQESLIFERIKELSGLAKKEKSSFFEERILMLLDDIIENKPVDYKQRVGEALLSALPNNIRNKHIKIINQLAP